MPRTLVAAVFLAAFASAADKVTEKQIDAVVTDALKKQQVPGVAVAVIHKGEVVVAKGYGEANVEHKVPVTADTVFQSGSVGKQFTAAVVCLLADRGKLKLDDPVTDFLPDAPFKWGKITVRHLLTHTSGMGDYTGEIDLRKDSTEDELAKLAFGLKLKFAPGSRWGYSNTGYAVLGVIVRKAGGRFYGDVLADDVFAPLGMTTARVINEADVIPNRAAGYRLEKGKLKNQEWVAPSVNTTADGALYLSAKDLVAWDKGIRDGKVLKAETWKEVFTPVKLTTGKTHPYGFGWGVDETGGHPHHHHGGAWQGFTSHISRYVGEDLSVMVLTNLSGAEPGAISQEIAALFNPKLANPSKK